MPHPILDPRCLRLLALLKAQDLPACQALLQRTLTQKPPEWLYLHMLIPAVYIAGEKFLAGQLHGVLIDTIVSQVRQLMTIPQAQLTRQPRLHKAFFATYMPGDVHSIGLLAIRDWLDRDGWDVTLPFPPPPLPQLAQQILATQPHAVGFSCGLPRSVANARRLIRTLKDSGLTAPIWIGGATINTVPSLFQKSGTERTAGDILSFTRELATEFHYQTATPTQDLESEI